MALTLSKEALKESLTADKAGAALTKIQDARVFKQMGTLLMIAGAVALGLFVFFWSQKPAYTPLYTGLDAKATAEATDMLRAAQIPFQLDQATGAISVPEENLHDARLKLAGAGLAESGRLGFEMMERDPGFGVSQFVENARYQHALETELVRTITTLRPVRDARVHLAIPKPSAFTRQKEPASASVVLQMQSGSTLEQGQVAEVWADFAQLIAAYTREGQGYTARRALESVRDDGDYDHLSRFGEWDLTDDPAPEDLA